MTSLRVDTRPYPSATGVLKGAAELQSSCPYTPATSWRSATLGGSLATQSLAGDSAGARDQPLTFVSDRKVSAGAGDAAPSAVNFRWVDPRAATDPTVASFDRLAQLKMATSQIAMHLEEAWRAGIFRQLDVLMDPDEWDFSDALPDTRAFQTFLRMIVYLGPVRRPSLGATSQGHILAAWHSGQDRLTIECAPSDSVRWVLAEHRGGDRESAAGQTTVRRLPEVLAPYTPNKWFAVADNLHTG